MKYAKIKNNSLEYAPRNKGNISNWINDEKAVLAEGYLPVELQEIPEGKYQVGYEVVDGIIARKLEDKPQPSEQELKELRIAELKQMLADTDYIDDKFIAAIVLEDKGLLETLKIKYLDKLRERESIRNQIDELLEV